MITVTFIIVIITYFLNCTALVCMYVCMYDVCTYVHMYVCIHTATHYMYIHLAFRDYFTKNMC